MYISLPIKAPVSVGDSVVDSVEAGLAGWAYMIRIVIRIAMEIRQMTVAIFIFFCDFIIDTPSSLSHE